MTLGSFSSLVNLALADVNGDGLLDIVLLNGNGGGHGTVYVLLNTTTPGATTPTFAKHTFTVGINPALLALGDLNGDGKVDVVVTNANDNTVSVLLDTTPTGSSTPSFTLQAIGTGSDPVGVTVGDINGDGKPDIIVGEYGGALWMS